MPLAWNYNTHNSVDKLKISVIKKIHANNFLKTIQKGVVHPMGMAQLVVHTKFMGE